MYWATVMHRVLIPAQSYSLRMRGTYSHGGGVWTDPVSIIVV